MEQTAIQQAQPTGKGKKILLIGLSLAATGTLGYFGYQWWSKTNNKTTQDELPNMDLTPPPNNSFSVPTVPLKRNDDFPLKKGSKGARVKQLQDVLMEKHGKDALPKYGADGDFGTELQNALVKFNYPSSIDENTFHVLVQAGGLDSEAIARELYVDAMKKDFSATIKSLQKLKSTEDYTSVSEIFKTNYRINGVRQTLVNGMLNSFSDEKQKQSIRLQFTRMGLNYDGNKWSLSGLETSSIITKQATVVWINPKVAIHVPANMVLGKVVEQKGIFILFENKGKCFLVPSKTINYL